MASYYDICEQEDLLLELSDAERGALWRAVILYRRGSDPGEGLMRSVRPAFAMIRSGIDAYTRRRREICAARQVPPNAARRRKLPGVAGVAAPSILPLQYSPRVPPLRGNTAPRGRAAFARPLFHVV